MKTTNLSTLKRTRRGGLGFAILLLSSLGVRAQHNSEYTFRQQSVADGVAFNSNGDPVPVLTMDCLAANGYGQWTLSKTPNGTDYPAGWYLLANGLYPPSTRYDGGHPTVHPGCIPPGVVQNDVLTGITTPPLEPEATANLFGSINYVWPSASRQTFDVQFYNGSDIDISLGFLANPTPPLKLITTPIHVGSISTTAGGFTHDIASVTPYPDEYDVKSDGAYLYTTWSSSIHSTHGVNVSEVWYTVVDVVTKAVVIAPTVIADGIRPRIICYPGSNPSSPLFDVAFIAPPYVMSGATIVGGGISWLHYNSGFTPYLVTNIVINPNGGANLTWTYATHVCPLLNTTHPALYAITEINANTLILYNNDDPQIPIGQAAYVDGQLLTPPVPIPPGSSSAGWPIVDAPIVAFANPYDNQNISTDAPPNWRGYDQYHCLYQINAVPLLKNPLVIVRCSDNAETNPLQPNPNSLTNHFDTRLILNCDPSGNPIDDPSNYCAAVNQMGIHVHWRTMTSVHFYARDTSRAFDEDVIENTLVTDICTVSNGTAHGGTVGGTIKGQLTMAIWTDPNYGASRTDVNSGLYQLRWSCNGIDSHVGMLNFRGDNVTLYVGGEQTTTGVQGMYLPTLTDMPYFYFNFFGQGQGVVVHGIWDYYGLIATHNPTTFSVTSLRTPFTDGIGRSSLLDCLDFGGGKISVGMYILWPANQIDGDVAPAILNVHGGADFTTGARGTLLVDPLGWTGSGGNVDVLYEPSVYPLTTGTANDKVTGHMTLRGKSTFSGGATVEGYIPFEQAQVIMTIESGYVGATSPPASNDQQFFASNAAFENYVSLHPRKGGGISELRFGLNAADSYSWRSVFDGCDLSHTCIHYIDPGPASDITIKNSIFNYPRYYGIYIENHDSDPTYTECPNMLIDQNQFSTLYVNSDPQFYGIYIRNFDDQAQPSLLTFGTITISDNDFSYPIYSAGGQNYDAIVLENTTANVLGNTIAGSGFSQGIVAIATPFQQNTLPPYTYSLICSNDISGMNNGIKSDRLDGYVKKNVLHGNESNYYSTGNDISNLIFNTMSTPTGADLLIDGMAVPDLSGVHGQVSGSDDYAAFNTIMGKSSATNHLAPIRIVSATASVTLANEYEHFIWQNYGQNVISDEESNSGSYRAKISSTASSPTQLYYIDQNFWGQDVDPGQARGTCLCYWNTQSSLSQEQDADNITFQAFSPLTLTGAPTVPSVDCEAGTGFVNSKAKSKVQSVDTGHGPPSGCQLLYNAGHGALNDRQWKVCYDSLKLFIETCPLWPESWRAFAQIDGSVTGLSGTDPGISQRHQAWLESVLYLNTVDPEYFCACVESFRLHAPNDTTPGHVSRSTNIGLSVLHWLIQNTTCDTPYLWSQYEAGRAGQRSDWLEDTTAYKLDTTVYPMSMFGLDTLLAKHFQFVSVKGTDNFASIVPTYALTKNPTDGQTELRFTLGSEAYVRVQVCDVLGRAVAGDERGKILSQGEHRQPLDLSMSPAGTYYLRISLGTGEARTIKIVKE